jgi:hypothetical protein
MLPRIALAAVAATAFASSATAAQLDGQTGFSLELVGHVPTICRAEIENTIVAPTSGKVSLGTMKEYCNVANGYEIYAEHSPGLAGAVLVVDGIDVALSDSGPTRISGSDHADIVSRSLELRLPDGRTLDGANLSFRVVPL